MKMTTDSSQSSAPISSFKSQLQLVTDTFLKLSAEQQSEAVRLIQGLHSTLLNQVCLDYGDASCSETNQLFTPQEETSNLENSNDVSQIPIPAKECLLQFEQFVATCGDLGKIHGYLHPITNCDDSVPNVSLETIAVPEKLPVSSHLKSVFNKGHEVPLPTDSRHQQQCLNENDELLHQVPTTSTNQATSSEVSTENNSVSPSFVTINSASHHIENSDVIANENEVFSTSATEQTSEDSVLASEELMQENGSSARTNGVLPRTKIHTPAVKQSLVDEPKMIRTRRLLRTRNKTETSTENKEDGLSKCNLCSLTFLQEQDLKKHLLIHKKSSCKFCASQFSRQKALRQHLKLVHKFVEERKIYKCSFCSRSFFKQRLLYVHLNEHAEGKTVCLKCGHTSETEEAHIQHLRKHEEAAKFYCVRCGERFHRRQQFQQHVSGHEKHVCSLCSTNFSTKKLLIKHRQSVHGIPFKEEKKHECLICKKRFQRPMLLQIHQRIHNDERPTQCSQCLKSFRTTKALSKHMKTVSHLKHAGCSQAEVAELEKPYLCAQCGAKFYRRQGLLRHMRQLHSDTESFECPYCSYRCRCKTNLKRHIDLHTDRRRFVCELCGSAFHALATLKEHHAYVHSEHRGFVCEQCGKGFKGKSGLKRHMRIHSDDRPYVCRCGQAYKRMSHLKRHMVSAHHIQFNSTRVKRIGEDDTSEEETPATEESASAPTAFNSIAVVLAPKDRETNLSTDQYILVKGLDKDLVGEPLVSFMAPESHSCDLVNISVTPISLEIPSLEFHVHPSNLERNGPNFIELDSKASSEGSREETNVIFEKGDSTIHQQPSLEKFALSTGANGDAWAQSVNGEKRDTLKELLTSPLQFTISASSSQSFCITGSPVHSQEPPLYTDGVEHFLTV